MALTTVTAWYSDGADIYRFSDGGTLPSGRDTLVAGTDEPTPSNTGIIDGITLTDYSSPTSISADTTIENRRITAILTVNAANVTFRNCHFNATATAAGHQVKCWDAGVSNLQFIDCTFEPDWSSVPHTVSDTAGGHSQVPAAIKGHNFTALRCKFIGVGDCAQIFNTNAAAANVVFQQCYAIDFAHWRPFSGDSTGLHNDGIQISGGTNIDILGNAFHGYNSLSIGDGQALEGSSGSFPSGHGTPSTYWNTGDDNKKWIYGACIFAKPDSTDIETLTIDGNWLYGGAVQINISDTGGTPQPDLVITNNRFGNPGTVDGGKDDTPAIIATGSRTGATISGNTYMNGSDADADI